MIGKKTALDIKNTVSIIIPVFNKVDYTKDCIASLLNTLPADTEVIIVDNGSTDGTGQYLSTLPPGFRVITNGINMGFSKACNQGARSARGRYLVFLNNDTITLPHWLEEMVKTAGEDENIAVVGSRLLYPGGKLQHAGVILVQSRQEPLMALHAFYKMPGDWPAANEPRDYQAVTGACLLIIRDIFFEVGGFDEEYINGYEDVDLCFKVRQTGRRVTYCPTSVLYHHESVSEGRHRHAAYNSALLHKKWLGRVSPEYFYNNGQLSEWHPPVSVLLATHNSMDTIKNCVNALLASTTPADQIVIIDNNSTDGTREYLMGLKTRQPSLNITLNGECRGLTGAYGMGLSQCHKEYVAILRPGTQVARGWLGALKYFKEDNVGAVGPVTNKKADRQWFQYYLNTSDLPVEITVDQLEKLLGEKNRGKAAETRLLDSFCTILPKNFAERLDLFKTGETLENYAAELSRKLVNNGFRLLIAADAFVYCDPAAGPGSHPAQEHSPGRSPKLTSIVIPCLDQIAYTRQCVESIFEHTPEPFELIFINNGSSDGTGEYLRQLAPPNSNVVVISNSRNIGFGAACNQGIKASSGNYILLLNNDTVVTPGWLTRMLAAGRRLKDVGIIGPRSNVVSGAQRIIDIPYGSAEEMREFARHRAVEFASRGFETNRLIGFCMLIKKEVIDKIGGFDRRFGMGNFEDDDICLRARIAGYRLWVCDDVFVHHYGSVTFNGARLDHSRLMAENLEKFREKWGLPESVRDINGYDLSPMISQPFDPGLHYCPLE